MTAFMAMKIYNTHAVLPAKTETIMDKCSKHQIELECMGGCSAHRDNWYCPECDKEEVSAKQTNTVAGQNQLFVNWPKDGSRYLCNSDNPMPENIPAGSRWAHAEVECIGDDYGGLSGGGDYDRMQCKICGASWWSELPD